MGLRRRLVRERHRRRGHPHVHGGRPLLPHSLTVTDDDGATSRLVEEVLVDVPAAPTVHTGGASGSTVHGAIVPENQASTWFVEYGPDERVRGGDLVELAAGRLGPAPGEHRPARARGGRLYHYRLVADNASGSTSGDDRVMVAGARLAPTPTAPLLSARRASRATGASASCPAPPPWTRRPPARAPSRAATCSASRACSARCENTSTSFDGASGEIDDAGQPARRERHDGGLVPVARGHRGPPRQHLNRRDRLDARVRVANGDLAYRLGGQGFDTGELVGTVRDGQLAPHRRDEDRHRGRPVRGRRAGALLSDGAPARSSPPGRGT